MQFANKGKPIREYCNDNALKSERVKKLASDHGLTNAAIYGYIESRRDIRVLNGEIFEIKKLKGKG